MKRRGVYLIVFTLVLTLVLISLISVVYAAPSVTITASPTTVQINDIITLTVTANDNNGLSNISAKIQGGYINYNCNGLTSCINRWYTSYPGTITAYPEAKACNTNNECTTIFTTVSVVPPDFDDPPVIQDKSVSPSTVNTGQTITIIISATDDRSITKLSYRKQGGTWNDFNCNINENPIFCENTFTTSESATGNYTYEARAVDGSNNIVTATIGTITITQPTQTCPTCSLPSAFSTCINSQQTRTNYKCDSATNYQCQSYTQTQLCYQCSDTYDNDNDGKIDYPTDPGCSSATDNNETDLEACSWSSQNCPPNADTKCQTGHPKCSCTGQQDLKAYLCSSNQVCAGTSLTHNEPILGICCSIPCASSQTNQTSNQTSECTPGEEALCLPDSNGCAQKKTCTSAPAWSNCYKINLTCMATEDCIDTTASGTCSQAFPGTLCINGQLIQSLLCPTSSNTTTTTSTTGSCFELWNCSAGWTTPCSNDYHACIKWDDINKCGTTNNQPPNYQPCSYTQTPAYGQYQTYLQSQSFKGSESEPGRILVYGQGEGTSVQNLFNALIPRGYSLKLGLDTSLALLIISIFIASVFFYYFAKYKHPVKQIKEKIKLPQAKEPLKPVKINDLMLNVIESLEGDEKRITQKLIEGEGIRISKLREILSINKTKMEIALSKLERRQIIKERTDDDSKLYFNDWLK